MTLPIISADQRLSEQRGIKGCIFGKSGIGKTFLLWTLPEDKTVTSNALESHTSTMKEISYG